MFHGNSKIIRKSQIDTDYRSIFLDELNTRTTYTNCFEIDDPKKPIEKTIVQFLKDQQFACSNKIVEYWFQDKQASDSLWPHVDFNENTRLRLQEGESIPPEQLMSPITIACYLEVNELVGGEFCISERSWLDYEREIQPPDALLEELKKYTHETYQPITGDVLYFEGSRYYHWIAPIVHGSRKSMLLNFWNSSPLASAL